MRRTMTLVAMITALGLCASAAMAKPVEKVEMAAKYLSKDRKANTGSLSLRTTFTITDDSGPAPEPLTRVLLRFPKGAKTNGKSYPKCSTSSLAGKGVAGCSKSTRIGSGTATAAALPIVPKVNANVTLFNGTLVGGSPSVIIYAIPDIGPNQIYQGPLQKGGGTPYGYVLDTKVPPIQTLPGAPDASVTSFSATVNPKPVKKGKRRIPYIEAPLLCNGTFFLIDGAFSYKSGLTNTVYERFTINGGPRCP